jgi:hypothetical protein
MICHVSELRVGDTFRFVTDDEEPMRPRVVSEIKTLDNGRLEVVAGNTRTTCIEDANSGPVMVEILNRT